MSHISSIPFEKVDIDDYYRVFGKFKDKVWVEIETGIAFMHGNKKIKFWNTSQIALFAILTYFKTYFLKGIYN